MKLFITFFFSIIIISNLLAQPTISSFSPVNGAIGSSVTITGTNFNTTISQNIVFFGATKALITAATATSLTVTVPLGATYQYLSVTNLAISLTAYSAKPFNVTFSGNNNFAAKVNFATGLNPYSVSICDLDGDGKPDMVVANGESYTISVYHNISSIGQVNFAAKIDYATGNSPLSISIKDLDGDSKPDLVVTFGNGVSAFRNTSMPGSISFSARVDFMGSNASQLVSINDIDGDGKPDLAIICMYSDILEVFLNTSTHGNISFSPSMNFATGTGNSVNPVSVNIGDLDGDGKPDLAVVNQNRSSIAIFRNTSTMGLISFAAKLNFGVGPSPNTINFGDFDGDGKADLAIVNESGNSVSILHNTSTLGFINFGVKMDIATGTSPYSASIGDMDGDGKPDLAVTNWGSGIVSILRNTSTVGAISFAVKEDFVSGKFPWALCIGDIDGDGKPDLAVTNNQDSMVSVLSLSQTKALPVCFVSANAIRKNTQVIIGFNVATEINITTYNIERSLDSRIFTTVGMLPATGKSAGILRYVFTDAAAPATNLFYRIKSIGLAGEINYSTITTVSAITVKAGFFISPNPVENRQINIQFKNQPSGKYTLRLVNSIGQSVFTRILQHAGDNNTQVLNLPGSITRGTYQAELHCANGAIRTQTIIINSKN